jgi:chloramphenicol 3-O-phosphotransferase
MKTVNSQNESANMKIEPMKPIIILSGPVGSGKSTVAQEMIKASPGPTVYIEGDKFWFFIAKCFKDIGHVKNFKTIMASMTAAAIPYALSGYEVIIDFSIPPWFLPTAFRMTNRREIHLDYIVLRPGEEVCAVRAADRTEGQISDYSQYHDLYSSFDEARQYTIHDDTSEAATIAKLIRKNLNAGLFRVSM